MPGDVTPWDPNDWERHIQRVLKLRYAQPVGSYQHVADDIKGDCGIEGFAVDGTAYQCYACQNWNDFGVLLDHQKNKMTLDISKLLRNEAELLTILGDSLPRPLIRANRYSDAPYCRKRLKAAVEFWLVPGLQPSAKVGA